MSSVDVDNRQIEIDEDACLALTNSAIQCGNGTDTDASDPEAGLCGVHAGSDAVRVTDFENPAYVDLRDDLVDLIRSETEAYALATISTDVEDVWHALTGLQDLAIGPVELSASQACGRARALADHPDLDVDDHPLVVGGCIALQGRSAKNNSCPNSGYGTTLLCGMHKDADLRGTVLDDDEPGPDLDTVTVDGAEYQLVEQRGDDLIVVDPDEWELCRLEGAAGAETRWNDKATTPDLSDDAETLVLVGCGDAKADEPRKAKNLYTSGWSTLKHRYAEEYGDEWAILSAKYGLLDPEVEIDPYDVSMDDVDEGDWEVAVLEYLPDIRDTEIVLLAGPDYTTIEGDLTMYGADVKIPTEGKSIPKRNGWLSEQLDDNQEDVDEADEVVAEIETMSPARRSTCELKLRHIVTVDGDNAQTKIGITVNDSLENWGYEFDRPEMTLETQSQDFDTGPGKAYVIEMDDQDDIDEADVEDDDQDVDDAGDQEDEDVPPWLWSFDGPERLATFLRSNYATTDRAKELAKHFETVDEFDAASFEEKLRAAGVNGRARKVILDEYDDVADLQYRARSSHALTEHDGVGKTSAHVAGQSYLSWSSTSGAPPQGWNAIVDGEPEIAPDGGDDDHDGDGLNLRCPDCGNTVEDSPVMMDRCIECGGDLERVDGPVAPPQAPANLPKYLREGVEKQSPDRLRRLAEYAEKMAAWKDHKAERELEERAEQDVDETPDDWDEDKWREAVDDARDEADLQAGKGTLTTKNIDDRDYYYLQWREDSKIKSQYVAPVNPADSGGSG